METSPLPKESAGTPSLQLDTSPPKFARVTDALNSTGITYK